MADNWQDRLSRAISDLGAYGQRSYDELSRGVQSIPGAVGHYAQEYGKPAAEFAAGLLPGAGLVQGSEDFRRASTAAREGRYQDALVDALYGTANTGMEFIPAAAGIPALKRPARSEGIIAYHGSPHDFDRFDMSKIGSGEGAQAYGRGLYFAENEDVARAYRDRLSSPSVEHLKNYYTPGSVRPTEWGFDKVLDFRENPQGWAVQVIGTDKAGNPLRGEAPRWHSTAPDPKEIAAMGIEPGHMYQVRIDADPSQFLDWDAPVSAQTGAAGDFLTEKLKRYLGPTIEGQWGNFQSRPSGEVLRETLGRGPYAERLPEMATEAGVPGIKYLDAGSRGAGDGSRNYVVFDDKLVTILKKYGWVPGMAIPAAALAELGGQQEDMRMADGGAAEPEHFAEMERAGYHHAGVFPSAVPGRTDKLPVTVAAGAYILPADVVSALGEGNTLAGVKALESTIGEHKPRFAAGGGVKIIAAGGEYAIPPEVVRKLGDGDMDKGHNALDAFVKRVRAKNIKTLKGLPGPAQ